MYIRERRSHSSKGAEEEIATFHLMQAGKEEEIAATTQERHLSKQCLDLTGGIALWFADPVRHYRGRPVIRSKAAGRLIAFHRRGEQNAAGIAQDRVLERPIEELLEVLQRVLIPEPGAESAMSKHQIRCASAAGRETDG